MEKELGVVLADLSPPGLDVARLLRDKKIKVAVVLGEDPVGAPGFPQDLRDGLLAADFLLVGDLFLTATAASATVALPLSSAAETSGTMTNAERRVQRLQRAVPPAGGMETWEILSRLAGLLGYRFKMKYASAQDVTAEIRRVVPNWAGLDLAPPCGPGRGLPRASQGPVRRAGRSGRSRADSRARRPGGPLRGLVRGDLREGPRGAARRLGVGALARRAGYRRNVEMPLRIMRSHGAPWRARSNQSTGRTSVPRKSIPSFSTMWGGRNGARPIVSAATIARLQGT